MIILLTGDDRQAIRFQIQQYRDALDPDTLTLCYSRYTIADTTRADPTTGKEYTLTSAQVLQQGLDDAIGSLLLSSAKLVVLDAPALEKWNSDHLEQLPRLAQVPDSTTLILVSASLDKRTQVYKSLKRFAVVQEVEYQLPPPWKHEAIALRLRQMAQGMGVKLNAESLNYLASAIGNDTTRAEAELQKLQLATVAMAQALTLSQIRQLIPSTTASALDLAAAVRQGKQKQVMGLVQWLLSRNEPMPVMVGALITQFRTWLWVKGCVTHGMRDEAMAQLCELRNPKRLYYLKPEVQGLSLDALAQAMVELVQLDSAIKQGSVNDAVLLSTLLQVTALFATD